MHCVKLLYALCKAYTVRSQLNTVWFAPLLLTEYLCLDMRLSSVYIEYFFLKHHCHDSCASSPAIQRIINRRQILQTLLNAVWLCSRVVRGLSRRVRSPTPAAARLRPAAPAARHRPLSAHRVVPPHSQRAAHRRCSQRFHKRGSRATATRSAPSPLERSRLLVRTVHSWVRRARRWRLGARRYSAHRSAGACNLILNMIRQMQL